MAKVSKIVRNEQRQVLVARYAQRRQELKAIVKDPAVGLDAKIEARDALNRLPQATPAPSGCAAATASTGARAATSASPACPV